MKATQKKPKATPNTKLSPAAPTKALPEQRIFFPSRTPEKAQEMNEKARKIDQLLGGWKYENTWKALRRIAGILTEQKLLECDCLTVPADIWITNTLGKKVISDFVQGYSFDGRPLGVIRINSLYLDQNPPLYQVACYWLRELIRWASWHESLLNQMEKMIKTGKRLQKAMERFGLRTDTKGNTIEGTRLVDQNKFLFREILQKAGVECPEDFRCEIPVLAPLKKAKQKTIKEKIDSLQMKITQLIEEKQKLETEAQQITVDTIEYPTDNTCKKDTPQIAVDNAETELMLAETHKELKAVGDSSAGL